MAYLQSNEGNSEEIAGVVDGVLHDVSENVSQSSEERNGIRLVNSNPNTTTTATRITPEAVSALFGYFEFCNIPSNQTLPRKNSPGHEELDMIIHNFGLKRTQAASQLKSWKGSTFMIDEHVLTMSSVEIASSISDRLSISLEEIIEMSLDSMLPSKSKKMEMYLRKLTVFLFRVKSNVSGTESESVNSVFTLLKNVLTSYVTIISKNVPKILDMLDRSEFVFVIER